MLEQLRIETGSIGRSIPRPSSRSARGARPSCDPRSKAAEREWRRSAGPARMIDTLATELADPTADVVCETLLVAAEVGGSGSRRTARRTHRGPGRRPSPPEGRPRPAGRRSVRRAASSSPCPRAWRSRACPSAPVARRTRRRRASSSSRSVWSAIAGCWIWAGRYLRLPDERRLSVSNANVMRAALALGLALWAGTTLLLSRLRWFARPSLVERLSPYGPASVDRSVARSLLSVSTFQEVLQPLAAVVGECRRPAPRS